MYRDRYNNCGFLSIENKCSTVILKLAIALLQILKRNNREILEPRPESNQVNGPITYNTLIIAEVILPYGPLGTLKDLWLLLLKFWKLSALVLLD